jgi:hypothetical protein
MLCFVDESGDAGLKLDRGSSPFFTITAVIFEDHDEADACDQAINQLRRELSLPSNFEFHYTETPVRYCRRFFERVAGYPFRHLSLTIDKSNLYGERYLNRDILHKYTARLLFEKAVPYLDEAVVIFDGSGTRQFRRELQTYLKKKINTGDNRFIRSVKIKDSKSHNLVQLADMVCGAVTEELKFGENSCEFYRVVRQHEIAWEVWPPGSNKKTKRYVREG